MIDIHSHILPGVDDGARNMQETIEMLRAAYEEGIRIMIATPHYDNRHKQSFSKLEEKLELVRQAAWEMDSDFNIYMGNEIYYEEGIQEVLREKKAFTLAGGRYVLIEFSTSESYKVMYQGMKEFILEGFIPIIAHIERYDCLWKRTERIKDLVDLGCYMQINAASLIGGFFDLQAVYCRKLAENGLIHFIASDCHNTKSRKPIMKTSLSGLKKTMSAAQIQNLVLNNAYKVIENKYI